MKALKVLGIVFGIILLLTGGALIAGSAAVGKGQDVITTEMAKQGLTGPVDGTVTEVVDPNSKIYAVSFTDAKGTEQTAQAFSSLTSDSKVGDKVSVYYKTDDPSTAVIAAIPGVGSLDTVGSSLRTAGIACLAVGLVLLLAGILGLKLGKKPTPAIAGGPAYPGGPAQAPPGYPTQSYGNQPPPPPGYPVQPNQGQPYPGQPNQGQPYPGQPNQGQPNQGQPYPGQPNQGQPYPGRPSQGQPPATYSGPQYGSQPPPPPGYPSQPYQNQPPNYPPQNPPTAPPSAG